MITSTLMSAAMTTKGSLLEARRRARHYEYASARVRRFLWPVVLAGLALAFAFSDGSRAWAREALWPFDLSVNSAVCNTESDATEVMLTYRMLGMEAAHKLLKGYAKQKNRNGEPRCAMVRANFIVIREVLHVPGISVQGTMVDGYVLNVHVGRQVLPDLHVYTKTGYLLILRHNARQHVA